MRNVGILERKSGRMTIRLNSRRDFLVRAAKAAAFGVSGTAGLSRVSAFATPRTPAFTADGNARLIPYGAGVQSHARGSDMAYRAAIIANCQLIVPEGDMKWPILRPARKEYRFEKADFLMDFARQNKIEVRGHTLAWYGGGRGGGAARASPPPGGRGVGGRICNA